MDYYEEMEAPHERDKRTVFYYVINTKTFAY